MKKCFILISAVLITTSFSISKAAPANGPDFDTGCALVQLKGEPLATYAKTKPPQGKKIDFSSQTVKSYRALLSARRNEFKAWLRANAPKARVNGEYDLALNAIAVELNGTPLETLRRGPMVVRAEYQGLYYPAVTDPDLELIQAIQAWQVGGGPANAGAEVKVAIIDSGIDVRHPCFDDTGYPAKQQLGDRRFTNNKVIAARVFNNKAVSRGYTAEAIRDHGTHVAGTVACNYDTPATVNGVTIPFGVSGVAPRALLGNYNVFPADVAGARSEDILNALETAYRDGFDVANMSLGGGAHGIQDLLTLAVDNLDQADFLVAVAAGNAGPGYLTVQSPGSAARALTAGASSVPHNVFTPVTAGANSYGALAGQFGVVTTDLTAPLAVVTSAGSLSRACTPLEPNSLSGKIALISRGTCSFSTKVRHIQAAGAVAVLVVNTFPGDPLIMASDGTPNQPTIPAYMVSRVDGPAIAAMDGAPVTISSGYGYFQTASVDLMGDFSGQGPTDVDFRIKPDVVAPGVNVLSSIPIAFCGGSPCWAFFQGTSMATPHLAGSAAIVKWLYPDWSAAQVRSAIVNTADQDALKNYLNGAPQKDVNIAGAGRENLLAAVGAVVALDPVSVSFGAVPSGSGQTQTVNVTLSNLTDTDTTLDLAIQPGDSSVAYSVAPSTVALRAGASATVVVSMAAEKSAAFGNHQSTLTISSGGQEVAHAAVYTVIK